MSGSAFHPAMTFLELFEPAPDEAGTAADRRFAVDINERLESKAARTSVFCWPRKEDVAVAGGRDDCRAKDVRVREW
jgi:hypothetical protein